MSNHSLVCFGREHAEPVRRPSFAIVPRPHYFHRLSKTAVSQVNMWLFELQRALLGPILTALVIVFRLLHRGVCWPGSRLLRSNHTITIVIISLEFTQCGGRSGRSEF
jgi:hypothetical protein